MTKPTIEKTTLRVRAELLRSIVKREKKLDRLYGSRLRKLQRKLKGLSGSKVPRTVENEMRKLVRELLPEVRSAIEEGVAVGVDTGKAQFETLFGSEDVPAPKWPTSAERMSLVSAQLRGSMYVDKIPLSSRLWANHKRLGSTMARQIQKSIRAGAGMEKIAKEIVSRNPPLIEMPKYISDIRDAAVAAKELGDPSLLEDVVEKYRRNVEKLGSRAGPLFDSRTATKQFIRDLRTAEANEIDAIAQRYVTEKARQHAVTVARTETIHSYRASYYKSLEGQEWVHGVRWHLAGSHPKADICDVLASQDLYGLGDGGYPVDDVPINPHPNCMCYQTAIADRQHFRRELARRKGEKQPPKTWESGKKRTGAEWLATKSEKFRREMLGPTKAKAFQIKPNAVIDPKTGRISLVRELPKKLREAARKAAR